MVPPKSLAQDDEEPSDRSGSADPLSVDLALENDRLRAEIRALRSELTRCRSAPDGGAPGERTLQALRESEAWNRSIISSMAEGIVLQTAGGVIHTCNAAAERILGLTLDQMLGRTSLDPRWRAVHDDGSPFPGETHPAIVTLRTGLPCRDVIMGVHKPGGELTWISINAEPVFGADPEKPEAVVCSFTDVSAQRNAMAALRQSRERLRHALAAARMGTWEWDLEKRQVEWSERTEEIMGLERGTFDGRTETYLGLVYPPDQRALDQLVRSTVKNPERGDWFRAEHRVVLEGGALRWVEIHGSVLRNSHGRATRVTGTAVDISDRKELESRLLQAQKMETVGRLAGGVAHDFNNVLTAILNAAYLAAYTNRDPSVTEHLELIRSACQRATSVTRPLLAFARRQVLAAKSLDVAAVISEVADLLRRLVGEHIRIELDVAPDVQSISADEGQLEQVLINLAVNARDAMPQGGKLSILARNVGRAGETSGDDVDSCVEIQVVDEGTGMDENTLAHAFEPFFTTKDDGSGLGLATCYGIVHQAGGSISLDSAPGRGTRVIVRLPRDPRLSEDKRSLPPHDGPRTGTETILFVEDDPLIRRLVFRVLRDAGYRVLTASGGQEALDLARRHDGTIHLLLTDVVMPGLSGAAVARRLRTERPDTRVLFTSGYTAGALAHHGFDESRDPLLPKPYAPNVLTSKVREMLDG